MRHQSFLRSLESVAGSAAPSLALSAWATLRLTCYPLHETNVEVDGLQAVASNCFFLFSPRRFERAIRKRTKIPHQSWGYHRLKIPLPAPLPIRRERDRSVKAFDNRTNKNSAVMPLQGKAQRHPSLLQRLRLSDILRAALLVLSNFACDVSLNSRETRRNSEIFELE